MSLRGKIDLARMRWRIGMAGSRMASDTPWWLTGLLATLGLVAVCFSAAVLVAFVLN